MTTIEGLGPPAPLPSLPRPGAPARRADGFALPRPEESPAATADPAAVGHASGLGGLDALLTLQEEAPDPDARDRAARRRANDLLQALASLQRALLADDESAAVGALEALLRDPPIAADPGLAELAAAVTLRARVELARRGR
jgi:hypothetical protein